MPALQTTPPSQWRALARRPGYRGFVATVSVSRTVGALFNTAGVLLVLDRTGSAVLAGTVAAAAVLPGAALGPVLGAWLDVARHRRALIVSDQLLSVFALAAMIALAGHAPHWTLPAVAVLYGITRPFSTGSFVSALAELAGPELLDRASAVEATSMNLAIVVGPALAGALAAAIGPARVVELQVVLTVLVAAAIAVNPAFEARSDVRAASVVDAMRAGVRALIRDPVLRDTGLAGTLANGAWGLMLVTFPLYAARSLGAGHAAGGYLWAGLAIGSIAGTFLWRGVPSRRSISASYVAYALSALLWPLAGSLAAGFALVTLTGVLEGPGYSGMVALRQRYAPIEARTQVLNTFVATGQVAMSAGAVIGGVLPSTTVTFAAFAGTGLVAASIIGRWRVRPGRWAEPTA